ncbi:hypothetical protein H5U35_05510, partial [Candidatus Aerophobetes bacterium]|nr:hypothetical protein [Candidatus Aerophobetes bacterium]
NLNLNENGKISNFYEEKTLNSILAGVEKFDRWGFASGKGFLISKIYTTLVIPVILRSYLDGDIFTAESAALLINRMVKALER